MITTPRLHSRWLTAIFVLTTACAAVPAPPPRVAPRAMEASDRVSADRGVVLVDVTNADTRVRAGREGAACQTPCVLRLAPGTQRLLFEYEQDGRKSSDEAFVSVSEQPQVYRRRVRETLVRSPAGRITAITLWAVGQAAMFTALGLLAADDTAAESASPS